MAYSDLAPAPRRAAVKPLLNAATSAAQRSVVTQPHAVAQPASGSGSSAQPAAQANPYDFSSDPVLQQIIGLQNSNVASAEAYALAQRKRAEIDYGYDPNFAYEDQATAEAAKGNPFSVLANLSHGHELRVGNLNENLNKQNLFYSGYRGKQLGEEARGYLGEQYGAGQTFGNTLSGIAGNLLNAKQTANTNIGDAYTAAGGRATEFALANPGAFPAPASTAAPPLQSSLGNAKPKLRAGNLLSNIARPRVR